MKKPLQARFSSLAGSNAVRSSIAAAVAVLAAGSAYAQAAPSSFTIDTTSIVSVITSGVTTISAIGLAVLSLVVVIKMFKWAQRVLS